MRLNQGSYGMELVAPPAGRMLCVTSIPPTGGKTNALRRRAKLFWGFLLAVVGTSVIYAQTSHRLAIVELSGDVGGEFTALLRNSAPATFDLLDAALTRTAAQGAGYGGSLNLSRAEARALGQSLGCDFYVLGKVQLARRQAAGEQFYFDALAGLFFVETRTGQLLLFAFERAQAPHEQEAQAQLRELIKRDWARYAAALSAAHAQHEAEIASLSPTNSPITKVLSDETTAPGTEQPIFYQRLKPAYTEQADLAGIAGTVELEAVFGADGRVGEVEVLRWAGFGLDEAAVTTIRQLRFKPAMRDGKPLTIRGLVRYNFRRPLTQAASPQAASSEEIERLKRSLRELQFPKSTPGLRP